MKKLILFLLFSALSFAQVNVALMPVPHIQFLDSSGRPLAGGKLYTYQAGTNLQQASYSDSTGTVLNSNPVVLDAGGFANVWLDTTKSYKFVLQNALGSQQWTADNVANTSFVDLFTNQTIAGNKTWSGTQTFNGAVTLGGGTSVTGSMAVSGGMTANAINGVQAVDGVTNLDIQAAISAAGATGEVYIPAGTYQPSSQIVSASPIRICGAGESTVIQPTVALAAALFSFTGTGYGYEFCNLTIDMTNAPTMDAISLNVVAAHPVFRNVRVIYPSNGSGKAFNFGSANGGTLHLEDLTIVNPGYGLYIQGDTAQENFISNVTVDTPNAAGIDVERTASGDTGGEYFVNVRVTNSGLSATGKAWVFNSTVASTIGAVFMSSCVGDGTLAGGHTLSIVNESEFRITNSWFTNGALLAANFSGVYLSGASHVYLNHARISSNSRDLTMAGVETYVLFDHASFQGTNTNIYATGATLTSVRFDSPIFLAATPLSAADQALVAGGASSQANVLSTTGGQVWTLGGGGTSNTLDIFDATAAAANPHKYIRSNAGALQVENNAFTGVILNLTDVGALQVGTTVVGSLPAAASVPGAIMRVSDSTAVAAEGQACVGGNTNVALAFSTGAAWKCF
jgi:hypothetical protein